MRQPRSRLRSHGIPVWFPAAAALALTACHRPTQEANPPPEVGETVVQPHTVSLADEFNGRVEAVDSVELRPRVSGYLDRIAYQEGAYVTRGTVLFVIDQRPYRIALERAQAQLQRAQASAGLAQVQLKRVQALVAQRATSQEELDNAKATNDQSAADLASARAAVDDAKLNLDFTEVRAPVAGRVGRALLTVGNVARADDSTLTTVVSQDPVYVYFDCDEQSYLRYNAQHRDAGRQPIAQDEVRIGLASEPGFPHTGKVDFLDNQLNPATGTIRARVRLANPDHVFTPGLFAHVLLNSAPAAQVLLVDDKAVLTDQDQKYVYVIGPQDHALRRNVTVGRVIDGQRVIEAGLQPGDRVVTVGIQKVLYPGAVVKPVPAAPAAQARAPAGATNAAAGQAQ